MFSSKSSFFHFEVHDYGYTERIIYYLKSVMHLLKRMFYVRLSRCSTDLRKIFGHSILQSIDIFYDCAVHLCTITWRVNIGSIYNELWNINENVRYMIVMVLIMLLWKLTFVDVIFFSFLCVFFFFFFWCLLSGRNCRTILVC